MLFQISKIHPGVLPRRAFSSPLCVNWCPCSSCPHEWFPGKVPSPPSVGSLGQLIFPSHSCSSGSLGSRCFWPGGCTGVPLGVWGESCSRAPLDAGTGLQEHLDHSPEPFLLPKSPALLSGRCYNEDLQTLGYGQNSLNMTLNQFSRCFWVWVPPFPIIWTSSPGVSASESLHFPLFDQFSRCFWIWIPAFPQPFRERQWWQCQVGTQGAGVFR